MERIHPTHHLAGLCFILTISLLGCSDSESQPNNQTSNNVQSNNAQSNNTQSNNAQSNNAQSNNGSNNSTNNQTNNQTNQPDDAVFEMYREIREHIRSSPAHRVAEAERLILAKDAAAIFEFVRDHIRVAPVDRFASEFRPYQNRTLFGPRATLRGGLGSARDKTDLLAWMFNEAGFDATVKVAFAAENLRDPALLFQPVTEPTFDPPIDEEDIERWSTDYRVVLEPMDTRFVDPDQSVARGLADQLLSHVAPTNPIDLMPNLSDVRIPIVEVTLPPGGTVYANPLFPDLQLGESGTGNFIQDATPAPTLETSIRVWARHTDDEDREGRTLVEGRWADSELVGRRVVYRTRPTLDMREILHTRADQLRTFLPTLSVEGIDADEIEGATGPIVTLEGDVITQEDGRIRVNGEPFSSPIGEEERLALVTSMEVVADADAFPRVRLLLRPKDNAGNIVPGLRADLMVLDEDGVKVSGILRSNQIVPRVIFLVDRSTSVPETFRDQALKTLGLDLAQTIFGQDDAEIAVMGIGESNAQRKPFVSDLTSLEAQFDAGHGSGSRLWEALVDAVRRRPSVVVMVTDGVLEGSSLTPQIEGEIRRSGVPAVVLGAGMQDATVLQSLADVSNGIYVPVTSTEEARTAVLDFLETDQDPYELIYTAPELGSNTRTIEATLRGTQIHGEATYTLPDERIPPGGFAGIYITITRDNQSVTRTLAGIAPHIPLDQADQTTISDVEASFLGAATLMIEGGNPSWAQILEERLDMILAAEPLWLATNNREQFWDLLDQGLPTMPFPSYRHFYGDSTALGDAVATAPRFMLYTERPGYRPEAIERRIDMLAMTRWAGTSADSTQAWEAALRSSVAEALLESVYFDESTISLLDGAQLQAIPAETIAAHFADTDNQTQWVQSALAFDDEWTLVVPEESQNVAFWAIHEPTGTALAIVEGGGGSGSTSGGTPYNSTVGIAETLQYVYSLTGFKGGVWLSLEVAKAKQIARATAAIANLGSGIPFQPPNGTLPEETLESFICGEYEGTAIDLLPTPIRIAVRTYNRWASATDSPRICP